MKNHSHSSRRNNSIDKAKQDLHPLEPTKTHEKFDTYDWFKLIFCGLTLVPLRSLLIVILTIINCFLNKIAIFGLSSKDLQEKPLIGWRRVLRDITFKITCRMALFVLGFYWINVKGKCASKKDAPVVIGNHTSWIEPIIMYAQDSYSVVSKIENSKIPFFGNIFLGSQSLLLVREDKEKREQTRNIILERSTSKLPWKQLLIYPEGTCTNGNALIQFKQGAFLSGVPVQPVIVSFKRNKFYDPTFPVGVKMLTSFLRCCMQFVNYVDVTYLPVYVPSEQEKKDPFLYAEGVRQKMAETMSVPTTNHSLEDVLLMRSLNQKYKQKS